MKRKTIFTIVLTGLLIAGGTLAAFNNSQVSAQTDTTSKTPVWLDHDRRFRIDSDDLTAALDITEDELLAAKAIATGKAVDQALSLGLITQEQAEELKADTDLSLRDLYRLISKDDIAEIGYQAFLLEELGISAETYNVALASVQQAKLDAAVAEGSLTQADADLIAGQRALRNSTTFSNTMKTACVSAIQQALEEGTITQAQADALIAKLDTTGFDLFGGPGGGHGRGGHGPGGMGERGKGFGPDATEESISEDIDG